MHGVTGYAKEVAFLERKALFADEDPHFPVRHVIQLLAIVIVRLGMETGRTRGNHDAAVVAVGHLSRHRQVFAALEIHHALRRLAH